MIGAFPDLYPEELLVSGWARYENWVQYGHRMALMEDLFGYYKKSVDFVLPSCLGAFTSALPPRHTAASVEDLVTRHTLLPYYGAFQPAEQQQFLRQQMERYEGVNLRAPMGLSQSALQMPRMLRYCPTCAADDRTAFGETYWHRIHQAAGVMVCPEHAVWLEVTEAPMWVTPGKTTFPLAETTVPVSVPRPVNVEIVGEGHLLRLAQAVRWLLEHPDLSLEDFQLQARCRAQLVDMGLASYSKRFKQTEILDVFQETFTPELLAYLSCDWSNRYVTTCWLSRLLHGGHHSPKFVLYMLLLMLFVAEDVPAFLALPTDFAPFGSGPWPCLNPACPHDGQDCIALCDVYYHKDGIPRGTFTCPTCEFSYRRAGPDTSLDDVYRTNRQHILVRGPLWDAKFREVWFDPDMNVARMSSELRSTWQYLRRRGTELGLPFPPSGVRPTPLTSNPLPLQTQIMNVDPAVYRSQWLELLEQHPDWSVNNIREHHNKLYSWLRNNDRDWLNQNKPPRRYKKRKDTRVNWEQRDANLADEVSVGYEQLMTRQTVPFRVTKTAILNEIRRRSYYSQNHYRLPQTISRLEQLAETTENYAIRRIWHYARQFKETGEMPRRRVLAEKASVAGPPNRENPRLQAAVDEAIAWLREA